MPTWLQFTTTYPASICREILLFILLATSFYLRFSHLFLFSRNGVYAAKGAASVERKPSYPVVNVALDVVRLATAVLIGV